MHPGNEIHITLSASHPSVRALLQENVDIVFAPKNGNVDVAVVNFSPLVCIICESGGNMYDKQSWSIY